jgi:GT2 family glycosyltransferase
MTMGLASAFDCSVIVPTYNRAHLVAETLDSILRQTLAAQEIIVIDDGSTDNTAAVVAGYAPHVVYLRSSNQGPPAARNLGLARARMRWIALCDSDDLWGPDHLADIARLIRVAPEVQYVFTNFVAFTDGVWVSRTMFDDLPPSFWPADKREPFPGGWVLDQPLYPTLLLSDQPVFPSTTAFTRQLLDRIGGFDERLNRTPGEDLEFTLRCVREAPIGVLSEPMVSIRRHAGNHSRDLLQTLLGSIAVLRLAAAEHAIPEDWRRHARQQVVDRSAQAIDSCFARLEFAPLHSRYLKPAELSARLRLKLAIARLPEPAATSLARAAIAIADFGKGSRRILRRRTIG